jgi:hypothetical protein
MSGNRLVIAILVLVGLLGLVVLQWNKREAEDAKAPDVVAKLPELKKDDVTELTISPPGKTAVTVAKTDGTWKVTAPIQADADKDAIDTALSKLEELEPIAVAATQSENHEKLEVTEAKGVHVTAKQADKVVADIYIGAYLSGNTMVREKDAVNVTTAKGSFKYAFDKDVKEWRDRVVVETPADSVKAVTFTNKNGSWKFVKEGDEWKQAPGEKALASFDPAKVLSIVGTFISLRANDFAAEGVTPEAAQVTAAAPNGKVVAEVSSDAGDNQIVLYLGTKQEGGYYAMREGKTPIFVVSEYAGERLLPSIEKFAKDAPGESITVNPTKRAVGGGGPGLAEALKGKGLPAGHP